MPTQLLIRVSPTQNCGISNHFSLAFSLRNVTMLTRGKRAWILTGSHLLVVCLPESKKIQVTRRNKQVHFSELKFEWIGKSKEKVQFFNFIMHWNWLLLLEFCFVHFVQERRRRRKTVLFGLVFNYSLYEGTYFFGDVCVLQFSPPLSEPEFSVRFQLRNAASIRWHSIWMDLEWFCLFAYSFSAKFDLDLEFSWEKKGKFLLFSDAIIAWKKWVFFNFLLVFLRKKIDAPFPFGFSCLKVDKFWCSLDSRRKRFEMWIYNEFLAIFLGFRMEKRSIS